MKKVDAILGKVFLWGIPVVGLVVYFANHYYHGEFTPAVAKFKWLNDLSGLLLVLWMLQALYLTVRLMIVPAVREHFLSRLAFMKERDEREIILSGQAVKTSFLTSLAILVFLFCLASLQISIYRLPPEKAVDGMTGVVSLGFRFSLLEKCPPMSDGERPGNHNMFSYQGLPISNTTLIVGLIVWHIISYNLALRRLMRLPEQGGQTQGPGPEMRTSIT